jgi:hypothetical protein
VGGGGFVTHNLTLFPVCWFAGPSWGCSSEPHNPQSKSFLILLAYNALLGLFLGAPRNPQSHPFPNLLCWNALLAVQGVHFLSVYFFSVYNRPILGIRRPSLQFLEPARVSPSILQSPLSMLSFSYANPQSRSPLHPPCTPTPLCLPPIPSRPFG